MIAIGMGLAWGAYTLGLKGWALLQGWDITFAAMVSPVKWYEGPWPPPPIPSGQVFATPGGQGREIPGGTKTPAVGAGVSQTLQTNMPKAGA